LISVDHCARVPFEEAMVRSGLVREFLVLPCARMNKTLPFLVERLYKDPQAHAQLRDQNRAPDGHHFGAIRPERRVEMRRVQDLTHQPQDQVIAGNRGQGHQEKARSFTRFGRTFALERPISVEDETIERTTSVGNSIGQQQPGHALPWPEPEQAIQHEQVDGGIHAANQSEPHELPARPASCFSFGDGTHMCLVRFARQRCGRWQF
jgi:hypothetical protein